MPESAISPSRGLWRVLSENYAVLAGGIYLFAAVVGTTYYAILFDYFDLGVFDYWDAGDVLLAAFRQPLSLVFGIIAALIALMMVFEAEYNAWLRPKSELLWKLFGNYLTQKMGWRWTAGPVSAITFGVAWFLFVTGAIAIGEAKQIWRNETAPVTVTLADEVIEGRVIAATTTYLVLLVNSADNEARTAFAIPVEAIQSIRQCADRGGSLSRLFGKSQCPQPDDKASDKTETVPADVEENAGKDATAKK